MDFLYKIHYKLDIAIFKRSFDIRAGFFHALYSLPIINTYTKFYIDGMCTMPIYGHMKLTHVINYMIIKLHKIL